MKSNKKYGLIALWIGSGIGLLLTPFVANEMTQKAHTVN